MDVFFEVDPIQGQYMLLLIGGLCGLIGLVLIAAFRAARKKKKKSTAGGMAAMVIFVLAMAAAVFFINWQIYGGRFYRAHLSESQLTLEYHYPKRTVVIPATEVVRLGKTMATGEKLAPLIFHKNGMTYKGQKVKKRQFEADIRDLKHLLAVEVDD